MKMEGSGRFAPLDPSERTTSAPTEVMSQLPVSRHALSMKELIDGLWSAAFAQSFIRASPDREEPRYLGTERVDVARTDTTPASVERLRAARRPSLATTPFRTGRSPVTENGKARRMLSQLATTSALRYAATTSLVDRTFVHIDAELAAKIETLAVKTYFSSLTARSIEKSTPRPP